MLLFLLNSNYSFCQDVNYIRHDKTNLVPLTSYIKNSKKVLLRAISKGGSSIRDFKDSSGLRGGFQNEFKVYQQAGRICKNIGCSCLIKKKIISNRSTFFCEFCQK